MICQTVINGSAVLFDLSQPIDISIPITETNPVNAFHLPKALFDPFRAGDFVGSIEEGGPVRCDVVSFAPHGNGTHTECVGHIGGKQFSLMQALTQQLWTARLVTVAINASGAIDLESLQGAWHAHEEDALIIRTLPNNPDKRSRQWSGNKPPYVTPEAMQLVVDRGVQHLLIDLPSVDPEEDAGALEAHHVYWQYPHAPRTQATITELIMVPDSVSDGRYLLNLNAAAFDADAAPSRPMLYREMIVR
jgi:arylformamidase